MEDFKDQLSALLNNPESMKMLSELAGGLLGGEKEKEQSAPEIPMEQLDMLMKVGSALNSRGEDERSRLLLALKPHLSGERQVKVDRAIKLLKLIEILPLLRESGLDLF